MVRNNKYQELINAGTHLPLVNTFYSVQGEGCHTGKAAYFIRIGGCDIGCRWCDTKLSWDPKIHEYVSIEQIVNDAAQYPAKSIVVTGGEPTLYNLHPLTEKLKKNNIKSFLETSGAFEITGDWNWICLSPKRENVPVASSYQKANELKVIIYDVEEDFNWAEKQAEKVGQGCHLFLQSEWSRFKQNTPQIVKYVLQNPKWGISVQVHKFMGIP